MRTYTLRRVLQAIPILLGISVIVFALMRLAPGTPFDHLIQPGVNLENARRHLCELGYCGPVYQQYFIWLREMLNGNFGWSIKYGRPVTDLMVERMGPTVALIFTAEIFALLVAIPMGVLAALRQNSALDHGISAVAFAGISTPSFFMALAAIYLFGVVWRIFPLPLANVEQVAIVGGQFGVWQRLPYMILPALVLSVRGLAVYTRFTRSSMLEVIRQDFVRTARAKGLSGRVVIFRHALRNALLPLITLLGLGFPALFGGALIIETIFSWPGMGLLVYDGVLNRDYPVIMTLNLFFATLVLAGNMLADIVYALVDPRIRYT